MGMPYTVLLPVIAREVLGGGAGTLGALTAASGLGALVGAIYLAARRSVVGLERVVAGMAAIFGVGLVGVSRAGVLWLALPLMFVTGGGLMLMWAACNTILQTIVDEDKRGRVMSLFAMAIFGTVPFGSLLSGALAHRIGAQSTLLAGGVVSVLSAAAFFRELPELRRAVRPIYVRLGSCRRSRRASRPRPTSRALRALHLNPSPEIIMTTSLVLDRRPPPSSSWTSRTAFCRALAIAAGEVLGRAASVARGGARRPARASCFVRVAFRPGYPEMSDRNVMTAMVKGTGRLLIDSPEAQIVDAMAPRAAEPVVVKHRVGPFGGTDLAPILRAHAVDTLVLAGVATSGVVLSTVRHAADEDYRLVIVEDACADADAEVHRVLMEKVFPRQATVVRGEAVVAALAKGA